MFLLHPGLPGHPVEPDSALRRFRRPARFLLRFKEFRQHEAARAYMSKSRPIGRSRQTADLSMAVLKSFRIIYGSVRQHFREVRRTCGISGSQLWLLHELARDSSLGVSELADKLSIHQSTCSLHVEKLVRAGFVKKMRASADQRRVQLSVTALGRRAIARAPGPAEGVLPEAIAELSPAALRGLNRGLQQIVSALDIKDAAAADRPLADM